MEQNSHPKKQKTNSKKGTHKSVRLSLDTAKKLTKIQRLINKKQFGKKVQPDTILSLALDQISDKQIEEMQQSSLSHADRIEIKYRDFLKQNPGTSKDEFLGKLLTGEISNTSVEKTANVTSKMQHSEV